MNRAWIGLGSNLGRPREQLGRAFAALEDLPRTLLAARSGLYRSAPMGPADQPDYLNAVALLETELEPLALLDRLQSIERAQGRQRGRRWGPRTLDLDLLLYDELVMDHPRLQLPHPGIGKRDFVLAPLLEVAGELEIPGRGRASRLLAKCTPRTARRIE